MSLPAASKRGWSKITPVQHGGFSMPTRAAPRARPAFSSSMNRSRPGPPPRDADALATAARAASNRTYASVPTRRNLPSRPSCSPNETPPFAEEPHSRDFTAISPISGGPILRRASARSSCRRSLRPPRHGGRRARECAGGEFPVGGTPFRPRRFRTSRIRKARQAERLFLGQRNARGRGQAPFALSHSRRLRRAAGAGACSRAGAEPAPASPARRCRQDIPGRQAARRRLSP